MLPRARCWNRVLSALFILAGVWGAAGGCSSCSGVQPLPGGALPADQTIEGGAQLRVTPRGLATITALVKPLLDQQVAAGFCLPGGSALGGAVSYCEADQGTCRNGCQVKPQLNSVTVSANPDDDKVVRAHIDARANVEVPVTILVGTCNVRVTVAHVTADVDVGLDIDAVTGELAIHPRPITSLGFSGDSFTSDGVVCRAITGLAGLIVDLLRSTVADFARDLLSPAIANVIDTLVPRPLGLVGTMNVGDLVAGLSPGTQATLETRLVPGGYAHMRSGGLSLGVITGLNADRDPTTRSAELASEPARCVPALPRPKLGAPPASLPATPGRSTFQLGAAAPFDGAPDPGGDVALGISESTLDLAGYHAVTSGALCLEVGTAQVPQLSVGTIGLLVRSLGLLASGTGKAPLLLAVRPQRAVDFRIGENTAASPALTIGIDHLEVDFYAFLYERYVRAFTLDLSLAAGVNLDFEQRAGQPVQIHPMLVGIDAKHVTIHVLNSEFVQEKPAELEAVLPSVFNLVTPLLGALPAISVPSLAGFDLTDLRVQHVTTSQDDFLAIYASLGSTALAQLAGQALGGPGAAAEPARGGEGAPVRSAGSARLAGVATPEVARVRAALRGEPGGALPRVTFEVDRVDAAGRELEWSYQLDGGIWRQWRSEAPLVIEDAAFAWQGKYTIGLKSRVKGDYRTVSEPIAVPVIIDSVAPRVMVEGAAWRGDRYEVPAFDEVSGRALRYALGRPGDPAPRSAWSSGVAGGAADRAADQTGASIALSRDDLARYGDARGQVAVFVADEVGNTEIAVVAPSPSLDAEAGGCGCDARRTPGAGGVLLLVAVGLMVRRRRGRAGLPAAGRVGEALARGAAGRWPAGGGGLGRRSVENRRRSRRAALGITAWAGVSVAAASQPGCSCHNGGTARPMVCESAADCGEASCDPGALTFCVDGACLCSPDVVAGRIGPYSDVAVSSDGAIWVSAYAESHGDLVVARATGGRIADESWEWVDGVPAGPVAVPGSKIRGGIDENGPDVGMYTSIAVGPDGVPVVSYFDRDTASLKLAQRIGGAWQTHVIEQGTGKLAARGALVGMYTSLTLRGDDGRPGVAYLAHVADGAGRRAEVRFATARTAHPASAADWQISVVDTAPLLPDDPSSPAMFPLPEGLGLFIDAARLPDQSPVVAYYDRANGDLKLARFDAQAGRFAAARVLDGSGGVDAGWSPSVAVDASGVVSVAYAGATARDLNFVSDAPGAVPEVIDDGYRTDGQTADGQPRPVFHLVGADAALVVSPGGAPLVVYQDATTQELLLAQRQPSGTWSRVSVAGGTEPWPGGYGFFASGALGAGQLVMSSWVINLPASSDRDASWVEVFTRPLPR